MARSNQGHTTTLHTYTPLPMSLLSISFLHLAFYCATIAYHVELNAILGGHGNPANVQEKSMFRVDRIPLS